ncbi:MAG: RNA pseudouridine synthase [Rhodothermaceae bacterium]|nr:RNA pseudouridine synthase [Rhodothermaceae bacterium]
MEVLYLDNHLLVVVKPPGLLAQADRTGDTDLLTQGKAFLKEKFDKPGNVFLGLVHRLDRPVSGVMVLARTSKAAGRLSKAFRERRVEKRYLALVEGRMSGAGEREDYLLKEDGRVRIVSADHPKGKRAVLRWQALGEEGRLSLVEVKLLTGRAHQVRVQLAALGTPILGDFRYGATRELDGRNLALHAYRLAFEHPVRREPLVFTAPPPVSWQGRFSASIKRLVA